MRQRNINIDRIAKHLKQKSYYYVGVEQHCNLNTPTVNSNYTDHMVCLFII